MNMLISVIDQGLIFSLVAMAVFITSRVINKDDLTTEGSFGLGGALSACLLAHHYSPIVASMLAVLLGASLGALTGLLYTRLKMNHLMAGLVVTTAAFSLSLALSSATKNVAYGDTLFALLPKLSEQTAEIVVLIAIAALMAYAGKCILASQVGLLLKATGDNPDLLLHFAQSKTRSYTLAFALANGLTALSGSLFVQWSGFFSITGNIGTLVTGLASLMLAELFYKKWSLVIILASIAYQGIFALTLTLGVDPLWNNLVKALVMVALVAAARLLHKTPGGRHA